MHSTFLSVMTVVFIVLFAVLYYSLKLQKKAVGTQDSAMSKVDESIAIAREGVALTREAIATNREVLAQQRETNRLLAIIAKEQQS